MSLTIADILRGTGTGAPQGAGQMQVVPILGDDDDTFAPPDLVIGTGGYGTVLLRNDSDRPTIVPPGAGWVVAQKAQDHALGGGALLRPGAERRIETAMCIQQSQGGLIAKAKHEMLILPAALRAKALSVRHVLDFKKLWEGIGEYNRSFGIREAGGHLAYFLKAFARELSEFVAEFEIVPRQVGAVVLVAGKIAGVERAPSAAYWRAVWGPLIRVCYGSLAMKVAELHKAPPVTRIALAVRERSLTGVRRALEEAQRREREVVDARVEIARSVAFSAAREAEETLGSIALTTVANDHLAGQVVTVGQAVRFASLCVAA